MAEWHGLNSAESKLVKRGFMNYLIVTEPDDVHAIVVSLVLESMGHQVINLFSADFPSRQKNSVFIDNREFRCQTEDAFQVTHHMGYDVVWWRRPRQPFMTKDKVFQADYRFHKRENRMFHESFTHQLAPHAWWINRKDAAFRANYKLLQLKVASDVGLIIPTTLCSNHAEEILNFYHKHQAQGIIYKPLTFQAWDEGDGFRICYTAKIEDENVLKNPSIKFFPGIYQEHIKKQYELRVTCLGDYIVAAKIDSQVFPEGKMDWRILNGRNVSIEPYEIPEELKVKIRFLMRELGLVFGCMDFIVTPEGEYIFLEVNEQGQFLFLEQLSDELPMLDIFIQFLLHRSVNFHWIKSKKIFNLIDFQSEIQKRLQENIQNHLDVRSLFVDKKAI